MSLCPEHDKRAAMNDAEFWEYVLLPYDAPDLEFDPEDGPHLVAFNCLRCNSAVRVDDYAELVDRQFDEFCDDCADEMTDDTEGAIQ